MSTAPIQAEFRRGIPPGLIDWDEHEEVYVAYVLKFGRCQSSERLAERGGFGKEEAEELLGRPLRTWRQR